MNPRLIGSLAQKDLAIFFRNRFFAMITVLGIVAYLVVYFVMPGAVDDTLEIGLNSPVSIPAFERLDEAGLAFVKVSSEERLREAVGDGDVIAGISLPAETLDRLRAGEKTAIRVFFGAGVPPEIKDAVGVVIQELGYQAAGQALEIDTTEEVLGIDLGGTPLPPRDRLRPLLAVMLIMVETMGLATLISAEIERRTINALLVTPATAADVFVAKGIAGLSLAFGQAALFMAIVGGLDRQPLLVLSALFLGAALVIGAGFIIGAVAKDMLSVLAWSMPVIIILVIPSLAVAFPGSVTGWVEALPTYYLVDTVHRASNFGAGWGDVWRNLLILGGFDLVLAWVGVVALRRRTQ
ncbi:MAG: ABC transporter permease [Chloroflexi bacterium]|nr:ABC transporter permease [Chloroflexota bacterium]